MKTTTTLAAIGLVFTSATAHANTFMDAAWAAQACEAWNGNAKLTSKLGGDAWAARDGDRGFKTIHMYREECGADSKVEIRITNENGEARCTYGGEVTNTSPDYKHDYLMYATNDDWLCMGEGKFGCGAMGAMAGGKLKFDGPKMEAMGVMGPFNQFLQLTGQVPGDVTACP